MTIVPNTACSCGFHLEISKVKCYAVKKDDKLKQVFIGVKKSITVKCTKRK